MNAHILLRTKPTKQLRGQVGDRPTGSATQAPHNRRRDQASVPMFLRCSDHRPADRPWVPHDMDEKEIRAKPLAQPKGGEKGTPSRLRGVDHHGVLMRQVREQRQGELLVIPPPRLRAWTEPLAKAG